MDILIFALIVLIVCAMLIYAVNYIAPGPPFDKIIIALIVIIGALAIIQRAGLI